MTLINPDFKFVLNETLILFDEMQACPDCATCLKFFKLDGRYDVICLGSLLGVNYNQITSVSVGYKEDYEMYSMDFEEFLWAIGNDTMMPLICHNFEKLHEVGQSMHRKCMDLFRQYLTVGGNATGSGKIRQFPCHSLCASHSRFGD